MNEQKIAEQDTTTETTSIQASEDIAQAKEREPANNYKLLTPVRESELPVDFRRVQHGHGPCTCCGPYSE